MSEQNLNEGSQLPMDIPTPGAESVEASELEWGPELPLTYDKAYWKDTIHTIDILNKNLKLGEKPWRLPSRDELITEFNKTAKTPSNFNGDYWSETTDPGDAEHTSIVNMNSGISLAVSKNTGTQAHFRLVR